jgi:hypothetical protein
VNSTPVTHTFDVQLPESSIQKRFLEIPGNEEQLPSFLEGSIYSLLDRDIIAPEYDEILFNIFKYLDNLVPNLLDYQSILTEEEINSAFVSVGALLGYKPNYKFLGKWSESFTGNDNRNLKKELEWRISDLYSIAIRRKLFGSYIGYKLLFTSLRRHGSVYLVGNYGSSVLDKDYKRQFRIIDNSQTVHFLPYDRTVINDYPVTGYIEGYTDILYYKNKYLTYDSNLTMDQASATDINRYLTYDSYNPIILDKTVFLDVTLDRVLVHKNRIGTYESLLDIEWLDFIEATAIDTKRASEKIKVGSQLTLITDTSGYYTKIDSGYTHPNTKAQVFIFGKKFDADPKPVKIAIGLGGKTKASWFKSIADLASTPLFGGESIEGGPLYEQQAFVDLSQLQNTVVDFTANTSGGDFTLENQIFETAISKSETIDNVLSDFTFIHSTIQSENIVDGFNQNIKVILNAANKDLVNRTVTANQTLILKDLSSMILANSTSSPSYLKNIQNDIFSQRTSIAKGSLNIKLILKPPVAQAQHRFVKVPSGDFEVYGDPVHIDNQDKFNYDFWIDGSAESVNPLWQYLEVRDVYNRYTKSWSQECRILKRIKVITPYSNYYDYKDITGTDEAYINVFHGYSYNIGPPETLTQNVNYVDYLTGILSFICFNNPSYETIIDGYLPSRQNFQTNPYFRFTKICDNLIDWYSIQLDTPFLNSNAEYFNTFKEQPTKVKTFTASGSTITSTNHGYSVGNTVILSSTQTLPAGLLKAQEYYVISPITDNTLTLSLNLELGTKTFTASGSTITSSSHGYSVGSTLTLSTTGTLPAGLTTSQQYYVIAPVTSNTLTLSLTSGGAAITVSGTGTGTHSLVNTAIGTPIAVSTPGTGVHSIRPTLSTKSDLILSDIKVTYITNTTQNLADTSDHESAIVAITEMGLYNGSGDLILYSRFPPIIYDSMKNHLSFNIYIKKTPIII